MVDDGVAVDHCFAMICAGFIHGNPTELARVTTVHLLRWAIKDTSLVLRMHIDAFIHRSAQTESRWCDCCTVVLKMTG